MSVIYSYSVYGHLVLITFYSLDFIDYAFILLTGNYLDSLSDAKAAIELQPSYLKAIVRGQASNDLSCSC